jgi:hypothetical protein
MALLDEGTDPYLRIDSTGLGAWHTAGHAVVRSLIVPSLIANQ